MTEDNLNRLITHHPDGLFSVVFDGSVWVGNISVQVTAGANGAADTVYVVTDPEVTDQRVYFEAAAVMCLVLEE